MLFVGNVVYFFLDGNKLVSICHYYFSLGLVAHIWALGLDVDIQLLYYIVVHFRAVLILLHRPDRYRDHVLRDSKDHVC